MNYTMTEIEERIYALLDEDKETLDELVEYADPGATPAKLIRMVLPDAAQITLSRIPMSELTECRHITDLYASGGGGVTHMTSDRAVMTLPPDFLRLIYFRMDDWESGVRTPLAWGGDPYRLRASDPVRGTRRRTRPAVTIAERGDIRQLEIFGTRSGSRPEIFDYIPKPEFTETGMELPRGSLSAVCSETAEMIRLIMKL